MPLLLFLSGINAQIALPTFQAVHKPHTSAYESGSQTFSYTGAQQTFTVPSGVSTITIQAYGAQGTNGNSPGGLGGYVVGDLTVTAGNTLYVYVGGRAGFNGGASGHSNGGSGGGASDVRSGGTAYTDRVIVAGGGGGGGYSNTKGNGGTGGGGTAVGSNCYGGGGGYGNPKNRKHSSIENDLKQEYLSVKYVEDNFKNYKFS